MKKSIKNNKFLKSIFKVEYNTIIKEGKVWGAIVVNAPGVKYIWWANSNTEIEYRRWSDTSVFLNRLVFKRELEASEIENLCKEHYYEKIYKK